MKLLAYNGSSDDYRLDELDIANLLDTVPAQPRLRFDSAEQAMQRWQILQDQFQAEVTVSQMREAAARMREQGTLKKWEEYISQA
jgi:hypothetical protein